MAKNITVHIVVEYFEHIVFKVLYDNVGLFVLKSLGNVIYSHAGTLLNLRHCFSIASYLETTDQGLQQQCIVGTHTYPGETKDMCLQL